MPRTGQGHHGSIRQYQGYQGKKKSLCLYEKGKGISVFIPYIGNAVSKILVDSCVVFARAGLLALASSYLPAFPTFLVSGVVGVCQRLQRRGPPRILTGFPVRPFQAPVQLY